MKILIWSQYFWPEAFHINMVAKELVRQGADVTVLTGKPNYPEGHCFPGYKVAGLSWEQYEGVNVVRVPLWPRGKNSRIGLFLNYLSFVLSGYLFAPYALREKKFDVVFVYAPSPLLQALPAICVAWLKRAPLVLWVQDIWPDALVATGHVKSRWILSLVSLAVRYIYHFSESILIQSEGFLDSVSRWTSQHERIRFFPNSAEDKLPIPTSPLGKSELCDAVAGSFSVVFAGNIGKAQSCETILEAAKILEGVTSIRFFLVGGGSMVDSLRDSISHGQLKNVAATGRLPVQEMGSIYESASLLLLTLRDESAFSATIPSKLQGYLAAGRPIVASCNGAAASVVDDACAGLTCPAGNAAALASTVLKLFQMGHDERDNFGKNGRRYFEAHYCLNNRVKELLTHLDGVIAHHRALKTVR